MNQVPQDPAFEEACDLAADGRFAEALRRLEASPSAHDAFHAGLRASWAMHAGELSEALAAADQAIEASVLQPGVSMADLVEACLRGASGEGLLRAKSDRISEDSLLHEPLSIRWLCLRKLGRRREAREMRALCLALFPTRASVWAEAGNQALDDDDEALAEGYFRSCLKLAQRHVPALAGMAIVHERRKAFEVALLYRARVVRASDALCTPGAANLQRTVRLAAAMLRVDRRQQAEQLFRLAVERGAFAALPQERPVLLHVFTEIFPDAQLVACLGEDVP